MKEIISGKMTEKGQLTIPNDLRLKWHLNKGDRLSFTIHDDGEITVKPKNQSIKNIAGILKTNIKYDEDTVKEDIGEYIGDEFRKSLEP